MFIAPLLPYLTDTDEQICALMAELAAAGVTGVSGIGLHLRPGAREWFFHWLSANRPDLVEPYRRLYVRGANLPVDYRRELSTRIRAIAAAHGLGQSAGTELTVDNPVRGVPGDSSAAFPAGSLPNVRAGGGNGADPEPALF